MNRRDELAQNLASVQQRITDACDASNRNISDVTLIVVSKTWPSSDIALLHELGMIHFGESREQEGHLKAQELSLANIVWHFIGQIQRNKARRIAQWANVIHSLDRPELIPLLGDREVLIQVNLDRRSNRGGVDPTGVLALADRIADSPLRLRGLMAVAPLDADPNAAFADLAVVHHQLQDRYPQATWLSAGMSGDFQEAIAHGATHVRLGTSILGSRPVLE